jgi:uncharacterized protein (DUF4415 family)
MTENNKSTTFQTSEGLEQNQSALLVREKSIDYSDIPELSDDWFLKAKRATRVPGKKQVSLRIDEDILEFFKQQGSRYQTKMHAVLRAYVDSSHNQASK